MYNSIIKDCLDRWKITDNLDDKIKIFKTNFNSWFERFNNNDESDIILKLLEHFFYYSHSFVNYYFKKSYYDIKNKYKNMSINNTIYTFIKSNSGIANSSIDYWHEYRLVNKINKKICFEDIGKISDEQFKSIEYIIFIDDFSGTSNTFVNHLKNKIEIYKNKTVIFVTIHIMKDAICNIKKIALENNFNVDFFQYKIQDKAFSNKYFISNINIKKEIFKNISKKLKINEKYIFGYKKSESLAAFYNNTPNNTLGIFWFDTCLNKAIFPRDNPDTPCWYNLSKNKKQRKVNNYNNRIKLSLIKE